jgi:hypothetical protein
MVARLQPSYASLALSAARIALLTAGSRASVEDRNVRIARQQVSEATVLIVTANTPDVTTVRRKAC